VSFVSEKISLKMRATEDRIRKENFEEVLDVTKKKSKLARYRIKGESILNFLGEKISESEFKVDPEKWYKTSFFSKKYSLSPLEVRIRINDTKEIKAKDINKGIKSRPWYRLKGEEILRWEKTKKKKFEDNLKKKK
jgi:ribosomal protein L25 (general stress protein Ctc)